MSTTPRLPLPPVTDESSTDAAPQARTYITEINGYLPAHARTFGKLHLGVIDPLMPRDVGELIRIRTTRVLDCYGCRNIRFAVAGQPILDEDTVVDFVRDGYETSDLPENYKAMLRYVDAYLFEPAAVAHDLRTALKEHFSEEEILRATFVVAAVSAGNRVIPALGLEELWDPLKEKEDPRRLEPGRISVGAAPGPVERDHPL